MIPTSSFFKSIETIFTIERGESFFISKAFSSAFNTVSFGVSLFAPIPTTSSLGLKEVVGTEKLYTVEEMTSAASAFSSSSVANEYSYLEAVSFFIMTLRFSTIRAMTGAILFMSSITSECFFANISIDSTPCESDAVVTTAVAPIRFAIFVASSFAPPRCPDRIGMTNFPHSSITMTAGSTSFETMYSLIILTAIPHAEINITAS